MEKISHYFHQAKTISLITVILFIALFILRMVINHSDFSAYTTEWLESIFQFLTIAFFLMLFGVIANLLTAMLYPLYLFLKEKILSIIPLRR